MRSSRDLRRDLGQRDPLTAAASPSRRHRSRAPRGSRHISPHLPTSPPRGRRQARRPRRAARRRRPACRGGAAADGYFLGAGGGEARRGHTRGTTANVCGAAAGRRWSSSTGLCTVTRTRATCWRGECRRLGRETGGAAAAAAAAAPSWRTARGPPAATHTRARTHAHTLTHSRAPRAHTRALGPPQSPQSCHAARPRPRPRRCRAEVGLTSS